MATPIGSACDRLLATPGLLACWDFAEPAGQPRQARGPAACALVEAAGPVARVAGGALGEHAAELREGQWFRIRRGDCGGLDLHGPDAQVTVLAWIRRHAKSRRICEHVAGLWDETRRCRQYALFIGAMNEHDRAVGHVSAIGAPTPGNAYCWTGSVGVEPVPLDTWCCIGFSYDGQHARTWRDGRLDGPGPRNPEPYPDGLFDGGPQGADFTVGAVAREGAPGPYDNFFVGSLGGLAVFDRALGEAEIAAVSAVGLPTTAR